MPVSLASFKNHFARLFTLYEDFRAACMLLGLASFTQQYVLGFIRIVACLLKSVSCVSVYYSSVCIDHNLSIL